METDTGEHTDGRGKDFQSFLFILVLNELWNPELARKLKDSSTELAAWERDAMV